MLGAPTFPIEGSARVGALELLSDALGNAEIGLAVRRSFHRAVLFAGNGFVERCVLRGFKLIEQMSEAFHRSVFRQGLALQHFLGVGNDGGLLGLQIGNFHTSEQFAVVDALRVHRQLRIEDAGRSRDEEILEAVRLHLVRSVKCEAGNIEQLLVDAKLASSFPGGCKLFAKRRP